jgi:transaldolase
MKLFIDSGSVKDIEGLVPLGIIDGVTTNPSLLAKESGDPHAIIKNICRIVQGPVSAEVVATNTAGMISEGRVLAKIDEHVVVKIPFTRDGIQAIKALSSEGIRINTTLIFSPTQALFAAKAGASYVSPFVGRLDDISTEVLVASVRGPMHIIESARMGADICTCPVAVIEQCFKHPLTDIGLEKFLKDWEKAQGAKV